SSRRRHTRSKRDWSSDVCSSDLPILTYMYDSSNASRYIILMAPFFLLLYIQAPLQAALFALDYAKQAMWNSFIGAIFKFAVLIFLASNATYGIMGVAIAISA